MTNTGLNLNLNREQWSRGDREATDKLKIGQSWRFLNDNSQPFVLSR